MAVFDLPRSAGERLAVPGAGLLRDAQHGVRRAASPMGAVRGAVVALCLLLALEDPHGVRVLPWLALGLVVGIASGRAVAPVGRTALLCLEAAVIAAGVHGTGGPASPLLTYLLAPAVAAGLTLGVPQVLQVVGAAVATLLATAVVLGANRPVAYAVESIRWIALSVACALVADWAVRLRRAEEPYGRAIDLLVQLRQLTESLPGSLDPWSVGGDLLDVCTLGLPVRRAAVLVQVGDSVAPVAVSGADSLPWRNPLSQDGPLRTAWTTRRTVLDVRGPEVRGRRRGSALLALPVVLGERTVAIVALESADPGAFSEAVVRRLGTLVADEALRVEAAIVFEDLRRSASVEERQRLAHEMHDGVAQDLAAVGFMLDYVRRTSTDCAVADVVEDLRQQVIGMVANIRLSITQLKGTIAPERGLGAALGQYARSASTGTGMTAHLSLSEGCFRLPLASEVELLRIAQSVITRARAAGSRNLWIELVTEAPAARLELSHDGQPGGLDEQLLMERAERVKASLGITVPAGRGATVTVTLGRNA